MIYFAFRYEYSMCYGDADANEYRSSLAESFRQFSDVPVVTQTPAVNQPRSKQSSPAPFAGLGMTYFPTFSISDGI